MTQNAQIQDKASPNESLVLTVGETAKLLRLSKTTVYDQIRQGTIPNIRMGKRILIPRAALMRKLGEAGVVWGFAFYERKERVSEE